MQSTVIALPRGAGTYSLSGRSALAQELMAINKRARDALLIPDGAVIAIDVVVVAARLLSDDQDPRPPIERLEDLRQLLPDVDDDRAEELASWAQAALLNFDKNRDQVERRLKRLTGSPFLDAARRMIGSAAYGRVIAAFNNDVAVVVLAFRRGLRYLMPLAVAIDDCAAMLSKEDLDEFNASDLLTKSSLSALVLLDQLFDNVLEGRISLVELTRHVDEYNTLSVDEVEAIAKQLRTVIEAQTRTDLQSLNSSLARKVQGAKDALTVSADAASQAANSMSEFIDRTLRNAFDDEYVLVWITKSGLKWREFVYVAPGGQERPTKRAQALCFVCAGMALREGQPLHHLAASSLSKVRKSLQKIKHADEGTEAELAEVRELMRGVQAFITYAIRIGWAGASADAVSDLRVRLADA